MIKGIFNGCSETECVCILPVSRLRVNHLVELSEAACLHNNNLNISEYLGSVYGPKEAMELILSSNFLESLPWGQAAASLVSIEEITDESVIVLKVALDESTLRFPDSHRSHSDILQYVMEVGERYMDRIRYNYCNLWEGKTLPGQVGLLTDADFCAGLFIFPALRRSYVVGTQISTHRLVNGVGLELDYVSPMENMKDGEVGKIAQQALRMLSEAMMATTESSKFVQMMSLLEHLGDPHRMMTMERAKKQIGRHIAKDRVEYESILNRFFRYNSKTDDASGTNSGIRHNIVHEGRRIEDVADEEERRAIYREIFFLAGRVIDSLIEHSDKDWHFIKELREGRKAYLGIQ